MLRIAELLTSHYFSGTLGELKVRQPSSELALERIGNTLFVREPSARLVDVLGRTVAEPSRQGDRAIFELMGLPPGCYFLTSETGSARILR
jgi:hypothetical protein